MWFAFGNANWFGKILSIYSWLGSLSLVKVYVGKHAFFVVAMQICFGNA
jgi:hypothetical protein